jgi:hypothetical protein
MEAYRYANMSLEHCEAQLIYEPQRACKARLAYEATLPAHQAQPTTVAVSVQGEIETLSAWLELI